MKILIRTAIIFLVIAAGASYVMFDHFGIRVVPTSHALTGDRVNGLVVAHDVIVSARIDGRIDKLSVDEGSVVRKGDVIAVMALEEAGADKRDQQASIDQIEIRIARGKENVDLEREQVASQISRSVAQLSVAESEQRQAVQELEHVRREATRARQLLDERIISRQDTERATNAVEIAESRLRALQDRVVAAKAELELARASERQISLAMREVDATKAELNQSRARMSRLMTRINYAQVVAPMSGVVSVRVAAEGEIVKAGSPIVTIVDLDDMWVKVSFEESYASQLSLGRETPVQLVSGEQLSGRIVQIAPESDYATQRDVSRAKRDIRTFSMKVRVDNAARKLHPGMTAYVFLPPLRDTVQDNPVRDKKAPSPQTPSVSSQARP